MREKTAGNPAKPRSSGWAPPVQDIRNALNAGVRACESEIRLNVPLDDAETIVAWLDKYRFDVPRADVSRHIRILLLYALTAFLVMGGIAGVLVFGSVTRQEAHYLFSIGMFNAGSIVACLSVWLSLLGQIRRLDRGQL